MTKPTKRPRRKRKGSQQEETTLAAMSGVAQQIFNTPPRDDWPEIEAEIVEQARKDQEAEES